MTAAATAAFSDSTGDCIGIVIRSSADSMSAGARPGPSPPTITADAPRRSTSKSDRPPRGTVAIVRQPWRRASAIALVAVSAKPMGSRNALPDDPRRAFQPNGSAQVPAAITLVGAARLSDANHGADVAWILNVARDEHERGRARVQPPGVRRGPVGQGDNRAGRSHRAQDGHHVRRRDDGFDTAFSKLGQERANVGPVERGRYDRRVLDGHGGGKRLGDEMQAVEQQHIGELSSGGRAISRDVGVVAARNASRHGRRRAYTVVPFA